MAHLYFATDCLVCRQSVDADGCTARVCRVCWNRTLAALAIVVAIAVVFFDVFEHFLGR